MPDLIRHPEILILLDSGVRRNDEKLGNLTFYDAIMDEIFGVLRSGTLYKIAERFYSYPSSGAALYKIPIYRNFIRSPTY
jgi:hypothetical protein